MWQMELASDLSAAPTAERAAIIEVYQQRTGFSREHLYRVAKKHRFDSGRSARSDKGTLKSGLTDGAVTWVAGVVKKTGRENKGPIMPVEAAMEIAYDAGIIERGVCSVGTMHRLLRGRQMDKESMKQPTPYTEMRSLHPNYCHLVDVSVCIQYYLKNGKMGIMDERDFYKNKLHNYAKIKQKLLRYVLTDHFSGIFYFRYYAADGETRENLWDFLKESWRSKADTRLPFRGVPFYMLMDAGCAQTSKAMKNFFSGLMIEIPQGMPHNPRKQGSVETIHNLIERWFETKLRICPATSVEELNGWALDFMIWFHATREHTRTRETRLESWLRITQEQLRECPNDEMLNWIFTEPEVECRTRNYRMSYRGKEFNLKHLPCLPAKGIVTARLNPYRWETEGMVTVVWQNTPYEVFEIKRLPAYEGGFSENSAIIGQEYKSQPETVTQRACKEIDLMAYGTATPKKGAAPFAGTPVFGTSADKVANLHTLAKRGTAIELARPAEPVRLPIMELFKRLRSAGLNMTPALNKELRAEFGETLAAAQMDEITERLTAGEDWRAPEAAAQAQ